MGKVLCIAKAHHVCQLFIVGLKLEPSGSLETTESQELLSKPCDKSGMKARDDLITSILRQWHVVDEAQNCKSGEI